MSPQSALGPQSGGPRLSRRRKRGNLRRNRGVADVIATILLLALTVVLFAGIFAFVTSFPSPPAQSANQFQATLSYNKTGYITGLNITHLSGPQINTGALIYVKSAGDPSGCFSGTPVTVGAGITTTIWTLGQVWRGPFTIFPACAGLPASSTWDTRFADNLTVFILSNGNLIFSVVLPGQAFLTPPTIVSTWTVPGTPTVSTTFKVFATIAGNLGGNKPTANLGGIPGQSSTPVTMFYNSTASAWQVNVTGGSSATGTYYAVVNIVNGINGLSATAAATVTVVAASSGTTPSLSVAPSIQPTPAFLRNPETLTATVTNSGPTTVTISSVTFWVNFTSNKTQNAIRTGTITHATITGYSSWAAAVSSTTWLPLYVASYNVTARVAFTSGSPVQGNATIVVGQPFTLAVNPSPAVVNASSPATFAIVLSNDGPLGGTVANVSLFIVWTTNGTHPWSTNGKSPVSNGHGGWWVTNNTYTQGTTTGAKLGAYATLFWNPTLSSPVGGPFTYTITVSVTMANSAWTTTYTLKAGNTISG